MEQTLVLIKPDGVKRGLVGEIISRFEKAGLKMVAAKLVVVKPELATKHYGYNDEWFENVGRKVKEFYQQEGMDEGEEFSKLANHQIGELVQKWNVEYLTEGPVLAMIWEGPVAIEVVRKIVGPTYPLTAPPGTIRGDFGLDSPSLSNREKRSVHNLVHASGNKEEANLEKQLWFKKEEIFSY